MRPSVKVSTLKKIKALDAYCTEYEIEYILKSTAQKYKLSYNEINHLTKYLYNNLKDDLHKQSIIWEWLN